MKFNKFYIALAIGFSLVSCKDFLEETPTGSLTSESELTSFPAGLALATGPYRSLPNWLDGADEWGGNLPSSLEFATGKAYSSYQGPKLWKYESDAVSGDMDYFNNQWNNWYRGVRDCNLAISKIPNVRDLTADDKSRFLGEVRALRAWYYFNLVRYFGDVVLNVGVLEDVAQAQQPRSSLKTVYDQVIIPDLEYAVNESALADARSTDGRITKYVARTILADVYLTCAGYPYQEIAASNDTTKRWAADGLWTATAYPVNSPSAKTFLQKAKQQLDVLYGKYALGTYDDLHNPDMNNKGEAIFQAQFLKGVRSNSFIFFPLPIGSRASVNNDEYGTFVPSQGYFDSYNPADKRIQDRQMFYFSDTKAPRHDPNEGPTPKFPLPHLYKYYDRQAIKFDRESSLNFTFYRYADVLLMLTEVNWTLRQLGEAVNDQDIIKGINEVRTRALLPTYQASNVNLFTIMSERAYELVFENKMLWDQRRTRTALVDGSGQFLRLEPLIGHQPKAFNYAFTAKHLLSPVSSREIDNNRNVLQNFGYTPKQVGQ